MVDPASRSVVMVIPSVNGARLLARMLPTVRCAPSQVVVLDQGSTDDTVAVCAAEGVEVVQLGQPHTYTQACNIGARIARERGCAYVCVSNNDIVFTTDVLAEMLDEMGRDPRLGIVAPSQIVVDDVLGRRMLCPRVFWDLDDVNFEHDTTVIDGAVERIEADFCELTCAVVRMSAIDEVGFLDDEFGFYHEDADFCFRLRQAGYGCAYLPRTQIEHFSSSTFNRERLQQKAEYITRNRRRFAQKHLGYGVAYEARPSRWNSFDRNLDIYAGRYGLLDDEAPRLVLSALGDRVDGYLYATAGSDRLPARWNRAADGYAAILTGSRRMRDALAAAGAADCFHVPLGVETDVYHPWGPTRRLADGPTYLALADGRQRPLLRVVLDAWARFGATRRGARLVVFGRDLDGCVGRVADRRYRAGPLDVSSFDAEGIEVQMTLTPLADQDLARLYRAADYTIVASAGESANLAVLGSIACGTPCIFDSADLAGELWLATGLPFRGGGVADGEALVAGLLANLEASAGCDGRALADAGARGVRAVRGQATLRHTVTGLGQALARLQARDPARVMGRLTLREPAIVAAVTGTEIPEEAVSTARRVTNWSARRLETAGRLTARFGSVLYYRGLSVASRDATRELRYFAASRVARLSRLGKTVRGRVQAKAGRLLRPITGDAGPAAGSVLLIGYIDAQLGLGESLRGLASAMAGTKVRFAIYPFGVGVEGRRGAAFMPERYDEARAHAVNVIEVTTDELPTVFEHVSPAHFSRSTNILRTYWELSLGPAAWRERLAGIDEIWAPTTFVADSFRTIFDGPITIVPPCVELEPSGLDGRRHFQLDADRFLFFFSFDYFSFIERKNPFAVVRSFLQAFPDLGTQVGLVVKSTGMGDHHIPMRDDLQAAALADPRIAIIDESVTRQEMLSLMEAADCYVSLHRSEGFGFGMAEALALGKSVIGTDYSGNTDYLNDATGYPVPFTLRRVGTDEYVYPEGQVWAEPDETAGAAAMVRVFRERDEAQARAAAGQALVRARYGAATVGRIVESRLGEIFRAG